MSEYESFIVKDLIAEAARTLAKAGVPQARLEAMSLIGHIIGHDRTYLLTHPEVQLAPSDVQTLRQIAEQRAEGKPLQYITGRQAFYGLDFEVTADVLIPRPETELLVEVAIDLLESSTDPQVVCDLGTGSGCIAVSILHELRHVRAVGIDISLRGLVVAGRNAEKISTRERLAFVASDCFTALDPHRTNFAMIVSNPPYIAETAMSGLQREVRDYEPRGALTPGGDGLQIIRRILAEAPPFLKAGGDLLMEIGFDQREAVEQMIKPETWKLIDVHKDLQGIPRVIALRRT
ncbi:MAG: release factor glutamine methyltransferase [Acidobacteriota bacterium]|jgi:release factor glutamine methyltransferase|nr:release factor glutamine methyltransferase [Acidobacteriota bacterium]